jgi:thiamine pyrophosphate-dependent acetolactate synthase large subunit-like protein
MGCSQAAADLLNAGCRTVILDPTRLGLRVAVDAPIVGDVRRTLTDLLPLLEAQVTCRMIHDTDLVALSWEDVTSGREILQYVNIDNNVYFVNIVFIL